MSARRFAATLAALLCVVLSLLWLGLHMGWSKVTTTPEPTATGSHDPYTARLMAQRDEWIALYQRRVA